MSSSVHLPSDEKAAAAPGIPQDRVLDLTDEPVAGTTGEPMPPDVAQRIAASLDQSPARQHCPA